jgi:hypothetical protein
MGWDSIGSAPSPEHNRHRGFFPDQLLGAINTGDFFPIGSRMRSTAGILPSVEGHLLSQELQMLQFGQDSLIA